MTTRLELRNAIRGELNDSGPVYLWPDARLDRWIVEAVHDYGRYLPREASVVLTSVGGQASYALPAGGSIHPEWSDGSVLLRAQGKSWREAVSPSMRCMAGNWCWSRPRRQTARR